MYYFYVEKGRKVDTDMEPAEEHLITQKKQDMLTQENTIDSTESMSKLPLT